MFKFDVGDEVLCHDGHTSAEGEIVSRGINFALSPIYLVLEKDGRKLAWLEHEITRKPATWAPSTEDQKVLKMWDQYYVPPPPNDDYHRCLDNIVNAGFTTYKPVCKVCDRDIHQWEIEYEQEQKSKG